MNYRWNTEPLGKENQRFFISAIWRSNYYGYILKGLVKQEVQRERAETLLLLQTENKTKTSLGFDGRTVTLIVELIHCVRSWCWPQLTTCRRHCGKCSSSQTCFGDISGMWIFSLKLERNNWDFVLLLLHACRNMDFVFGHFEGLVETSWHCQAAHPALVRR